MRGEQAIFNLEIKKKSGLSINPYIHHSKVFSSGLSDKLINRRCDDLSEIIQNWWKLARKWTFIYHCTQTKRSNSIGITILRLCDGVAPLDLILPSVRKAN